MGRNFPTALRGIRFYAASALLVAASLWGTSNGSAATVLQAAAQTPAVLANASLNIDLINGASVPSGQVASVLSLSTTGTHGSVTKQSSTTVTYSPGSYFSSVAKGSSATDRFSFCLADTAGTVSCSSATVTVFGAATTTASTTSSAYTCLRNWYVSQNGSDKAAGTTTSTPWLTLQHANDSKLLRAGDCVNVEPGTYPIAQMQVLAQGGDANSATGYVVYRSVTPQGAKLVAVGEGMQDVIQANGNYMIFDGFEINGGNAGLVRSPITTGNGITGEGHHFKVLNSLVHDCGAAGIGAIFHDWYWFEGNTVYNNAHFNAGQTSGISIYEPRAVSFTATTADTSASYHIIITNNTSFDNEELYVAGYHTDGNGIIMDDFHNSQSGGANYPYKSLVQGNKTYGNGGKGIHVFQSDNVTIDSNVAYNNNLDDLIVGTWRGELSDVGGNNNAWTNNQAAATSVSTDPQRQYNTAVLDTTATGYNSNVTWSNNYNFDTRTGGKSYRINDPSRATTFPTTNPLGKAL